MSRFFSFRKWFDRLLGPAPSGKPIRLRLEELKNRLGRRKKWRGIGGYSLAGQ
jgi:hypothetical protein